MNSPSRYDKFRAYRARKQAAGLREVRLWVPDVRSPEFRQRSERAAAILRVAPEEDETLHFIDALHDEAPGHWD